MNNFPSSSQQYKANHTEDKGKNNWNTILKMIFICLLFYIWFWWLLNLVKTFSPCKPLFDQGYWKTGFFYLKIYYTLIGVYLYLQIFNRNNEERNTMEFNIFKLNKWQYSPSVWLRIRLKGCESEACHAIYILKGHF